MIHRTRPVYLVLLAFWLVVVAWQGLEHARFQRDSREALINRSKDISSTVGVLLRSQRFFSIISQDRLESALTALVQPEELRGVSILNTRGETVASAGEPIDMEMSGLVPTGVHWGKDNVALVWVGRSVPLRCHWYSSGSTPRATTESCAVVPDPIARPTGWTRMTGGAEVTTSEATELVTLPLRLVATAA